MKRERRNTHTVKQRANNKRTSSLNIKETKNCSTDPFILSLLFCNKGIVGPRLAPGTFYWPLNPNWSRTESPAIKKLLTVLARSANLFMRLSESSLLLEVIHDKITNSELMIIKQCTFAFTAFVQLIKTNWRESVTQF